MFELIAYEVHGMDDFEKTKEEFLRELEELRRCVAKVEGVEENTNARSRENHKRKPIKYMWGLSRFGR